MDGLLQNVGLDLKRFLQTVIFSAVILPCLIGRTLAQNANMMTPAYAFTTELATVFQSYENTTEFGEIGPFDRIMKCYKCGAYRHRDMEEFEEKYKECKDLDTSKAEIEECPSYLAEKFTYTQCVVIKQTVSSKVTSFSRGCFYLRSCKEVKDCYDSDKGYTGVCRNCCNDTLCNSSAPVYSMWSMLAIGLLIGLCLR